MGTLRAILTPGKLCALSGTDIVPVQAGLQQGGAEGTVMRYRSAYKFSTLRWLEDRNVELALNCFGVLCFFDSLDGHDFSKI